MRLTSIKKRFGDILVDVGVITDKQLKTALDIQKKNGGKLGSILAQMGVINEEVMLAFLGKQCGVPYISLTEYGDISRKVAALLPESIIRFHTIIPIEREGNTLTIAMADPFNVFAIDDIKALTGFDVQVVIASESDIRKAIVACFSVIPASESTFHDPALTPHDSLQPASDDELLNEFLAKALQHAASLIYLEPEAGEVRVRCRIDGSIKQLPSLSRRTGSAIASRLLSLCALTALPDAAFARGSANINIHGKPVHIGLTRTPSFLGDRLSIRLHTHIDAPVDMAHIGFEPESLPLYQKTIESGEGLIIIAGPSLSGKTTTLCSSLTHLNYPDTNIISITESAEILMPGITHVPLLPFTGSAADASLRCVLDESPQVISFGEIVSPNTARCAMHAALSGTTVFAAVLASRFSEVLLPWEYPGNEPYLLARAVRLIVNQRLMRIICPACKESYEVSSSSVRHLATATPRTIDDTKKLALWRGRGCKNCNFTGYAGYTGVFEIAEPSPDMHPSRISSVQDLRDSFIINGLHLADSAWRKMEAGLTTAEEYLRIIRPRL